MMPEVNTAFLDGGAETVAAPRRLLSRDEVKKSLVYLAI